MIHWDSKKTCKYATCAFPPQKKTPIGCFLKWWYPQNTPKWSFLVGKPMVVGYHHFRKPPIDKNDITSAPWVPPFPLHHPRRWSCCGICWGTKDRRGCLQRVGQVIWRCKTLVKLPGWWLRDLTHKLKRRCFMWAFLLVARCFVACSFCIKKNPSLESPAMSCLNTGKTRGYWRPYPNDCLPT